jgi:hypothetical protein
VIKFLVCYDYGQGGGWFYVEAASAIELSRLYPALLVFPDPPPWWNDEYEAAARKNRGDQDPFKSILKSLRNSD